jgi:hypothetical protein
MPRARSAPGIARLAAPLALIALLIILLALYTCQSAVGPRDNQQLYKALAGADPPVGCTIARAATEDPALWNLDDWHGTFEIRCDSPQSLQQLLTALNLTEPGDPAQPLLTLETQGVPTWPNANDQRRLQHLMDGPSRNTAVIEGVIDQETLTAYITFVQT